MDPPHQCTPVGQYLLLLKWIKRKVPSLWLLYCLPFIIFFQSFFFISSRLWFSASVLQLLRLSPSIPLGISITLNWQCCKWFYNQDWTSTIAGDENGMNTATWNIFSSICTPWHTWTLPLFTHSLYPFLYWEITQSFIHHIGSFTHAGCLGLIVAPHFFLRKLLFHCLSLLSVISHMTSFTILSEKLKHDTHHQSIF